MVEQFSSRLRNCRENKGLSQEDVARFLDVAYGTYHRWEKGGTEPKVHQIIQLAKLLEVDINWLLLGTRETILHEVGDLPTLPLLGEIGAGFVGLTNELVVDADRIPVPQEWIDRGARYVIRVEGKSMIGAGIHPGDLIGIEPITDNDQIAPGNGRIYALHITQDQDDIGVMLKRLKVYSDVLWAVPDNPEMEPCPLSALGTEVRVFGRVVAMLRLF